MSLIFSPRQRILFIGDSITDAGRRRGDHPLGGGYVRRVADTLAKAYPDHELEIINHGVSGNTTRDLVTRWKRDVVGMNPDWIVILIGVNDVWRFVTQQLSDAVAVGEFEQNVRHILQRTTEALPKARIILMEPFLIEEDPDDLFRRMLDRYRTVLRTVAARYDLPLVQLQEAFDEVMRRGPTARPRDWAGDRVHPTPAGHAFIAREFLASCGHESKPKATNP